MPTLSTARILYVEDNQTDYALFSSMLEEHSEGRLQVQGAERLSEALRHLEQNHFSAVLLDLNLQDISGTQTVRILHDTHPRLPIVVFTGQQEDTLEQDAFASGAQEFLVKGQHSAEQIEHSLAQSIRRKKMETEFFLNAHYDRTTQLPNALLMEEHLKHAFHHARRHGRKAALLLLEVQNYPAIIHTFGHEQAAHMLQSFAAGMKHLIRESDILAHWHEGCYALLLDEAEGVEECYLIAYRLGVLLQQPVALSSGRVHISLAQGGALMSARTSHPGDLIIAAKKALGEARQHRGGLYVHDMDMDE